MQKDMSMKYAQGAKPLIEVRKADVIWNYIGTFISMTSSLLLLPMLVAYLSSDELGLWYVYVAIANLAVLFEFGFDPTFARNITYVISGTKKITQHGFTGAKDSTIDWHLLNVVIKASKIIFAIIAAIILLGLIVIGSPYIGFITRGIGSREVWISWAVFCVAIFLNVYFLWSLTVLRGYGDVAGENRARTIGKVAQLVLSALLLAQGAGLIGASLGYLANSVFLRVSSLLFLHKHANIESERKKDSREVLGAEVRDVLSSVGHIAWRDGVVSFANYASSQAISLISSAFLGLSATGAYSIALQLSTAVVNFASAYPKTFYPAVQASFAQNRSKDQRRYVATGVVAYWALFVVGVAGVVVVGIPIVSAMKPEATINISLFLALCAYLGLWNQHGIFCNYIIGMNEIPYMKAYLISAIAGVLLACALCGALGLGAWGIIVGQLTAQAFYNVWKWPIYLCKKLGTTYRSILVDGIKIWISKIVDKL